VQHYTKLLPVSYLSDLLTSFRKLTNCADQQIGKNHVTQQQREFGGFVGLNRFKPSLYVLSMD
jgi:hypothetical protein